MSDESENFGLQYAKISSQPRILAMGMDIGQTGYRKFSDGTDSLQHLSEVVGARGHIIINPWWSIVGSDLWNERLSAIKSVGEQYPETQFHVFCNATEEVDYLLARGFRAMLMNHNTFANDRIFRIIPQQKAFDAIYVAKMESFKRHELARKIPNLALLYSRFGDVKNYLPKVRSFLPNATFLNGDPNDGSYRTFDSEAVAQHINKSRVGLCLSRIEGAMYASIEYLLCGIPVVSTRSKGGRDLFFDDRYCAVVDDDPDAISAAVNGFISNPPDPVFVRDQTLGKITAARTQFIEFISRLQIADGAAPSGKEALDHMMSGRWSCWTFGTISQIRKAFET